MRALLFVVAGASLFACAADAPNESSTAQNLKSWNKLAANKLAANKLAANKLAANKLAANSLSSTRLVALTETAGILSEASGRDVYYYLVNCALAEGMTIEADVTGVADTAPPDTAYTCAGGRCTFPGGVGVAPEWQDHKLNPNGRGWVTACVLARVNAFATADAISLRGRNAALTISIDEAEQYTLEEGGFYGDVLDGSLDWNACRGFDQATQGEIGGLVLRDCTEPLGCTTDADCAQDVGNTCGGDGQCHTASGSLATACGFNYAGDCADFTPMYPSPYACSGFANNVYTDCHADSGLGKWPASPKYRQVVTTYVAN